MRYHIHRFLIIVFIGLFSNILFSKELLPKPRAAIVDYVGILNSSQLNYMKQKLKTFNDTSSTAIVIAIDKSTEGEDIFDYSYRLASAWGIGSKGKDNGVLMYIAFNDRKIFIQTGSGLEGVLTDAVLKRIIQNVIRPAFKKRQYFKGINKATDIMISLVSGEFSADDYVQSDDTFALAFFLLFLIIFGIIIYSIYKCKKSGDCNDGGGYYDGGRYNTGRRGGWIIGGGFGGSSGGFSGGGGFGGGGFGGFGGGGFSGGGAGGGW